MRLVLNAKPVRDAENSALDTNESADSSFTTSHLQMDIFQPRIRQDLQRGDQHIRDYHRLRRRHASPPKLPQTFNDNL